MKKWGLLIICLILGIRFGVPFFSKSTEAPFVKIPVRFFPFTDRPIIKVDIEGKKYSLLVDLGSSHPIDLFKKHLDQIKKETVGESKYIGIDGHSHLCMGYKLPPLKLLNLTIEGLVGFEENLDFQAHAKTWTPSGIMDSFKEQLSLYSQQGRIGWTVLKEFYCFFDFPHSSLYLAQNLDSLTQKTGLSFEGYIKIPIELGHQGIFLTLDIDQGPKKFLLDTGATRSVLRKSQSENKSVKIYGSRLMQGEQDFGIHQFLLFDFTEKLPCDGILGIDFFKRHSIYFDFHKKVAYIEPPHSASRTFW